MVNIDNWKPDPTKKYIKGLNEYQYCTALSCVSEN